MLKPVENMAWRCRSGRNTEVPRPDAEVGFQKRSESNFSLFSFISLQIICIGLMMVHRLDDAILKFMGILNVLWEEL